MKAICDKRTGKVLAFDTGDPDPTKIGKAVGSSDEIECRDATEEEMDSIRVSLSKPRTEPSPMGIVEKMEHLSEMMAAVIEVVEDIKKGSKDEITAKYREKIKWEE